MSDIDPLPIVRHHFEAISLTAKEKKDIEATFTQLAVLLRRKVLGDEVEDQGAEPVLPHNGEHLCIRIYVSTYRAQSIVERDDSLLTADEVNKHWP